MKRVAQRASLLRYLSTAPTPLCNVPGVDTLPLSVSGLPALDVARACAATARDLMRDGFGRVGVSHIKGRGNVLTETDLAIESAVISRLTEEFPDHAILSEETRADTRSEGWMWVVDPLDGTKNFSRGIPHFAFTIALCFESQPVLGLTLHPLLDEEFVAIRGSGTRLNGAPSTVSPVTKVEESVVGADLGYEDIRGQRQLELSLALFPGVQAFRFSGSAALGFAYAACGRFDTYVHSNLGPWDAAAGLLLVEEAGGVVVDRQGEPATMFSEGFIAGGKPLVADFLRLAGHLPWHS